MFSLKGYSRKSNMFLTSGGKQDEEVSKNEQTGPSPADSAADASNQSTSEWLMKLMKRQLGLESKDERPPQLLDTLDLDGIAKYIASGKCKKIVTMAGAGISTSAGIPDFRSPGTGLYDNLQKYELSSPTDIFNIDFFKENPEPFFQLAKELWPGIFKPTWCHYFLKLLETEGLLLRHYSQNIDTLEHVAGIDAEKIVEAHGTFHTSHCIDAECNTEYSQEWIKEKIFADEIPKCTKCESLVKPDIVFFGERLPNRFFTLAQQDMAECDLLIVMGTSLVVQPFASLTNRVSETCPRLYINLENATGSSDPMMALMGMGHGFRFDSEDNYRDVFWKGTCDEGCQKLAKAVGWEAKLNDLVHKEHAVIEAKISEEKKNVEKIKKDDPLESGKDSASNESTKENAKEKSEKEEVQVKTAGDTSSSDKAKNEDEKKAVDSTKIKGGNL